MGGRTYKRNSKKTALSQQRVTAKAKLNILGNKQGEYGGRFSKHADLIMEDGLTTYAGSPSKAAQLSDQLDKALSFLSSDKASSVTSATSSKSSASAYKVSLKNNFFASKMIKLSNSIKIDQRKTLLKKATIDQSNENSTVNDGETNASRRPARRCRKKKVKSNIDVVAQKIASMLGESSSEVIKLVVETFGPKEAMNLANLTLNQYADNEKIQSPLDLFLVFVELDYDIASDKRRKLMERIKRIRRPGSELSLKTRKLRKRNMKTMKRQMRSIQNDLDKLQLALIQPGPNPMPNDDSNEENKNQTNEGQTTSTSGFFMLPSRLKIALDGSTRCAFDDKPCITQECASTAPLPINQDIPVSASSNLIIKKSNFLLSPPKLTISNSSNNEHSASTNLFAIKKEPVTNVESKLFSVADLLKQHSV